MNKLLIVFLAVCLVSVHSAFVKREAPAQPINQNNMDIQKTLKELSDQVNNKVTEILDPETLKQHFTEITNSISKTIEKFAPANKQA